MVVRWEVVLGELQLQLVADAKFGEIHGANFLDVFATVATPVCGERKDWREVDRPKVGAPRIDAGGPG
jgi:hypothetical protein